MVEWDTGEQRADGTLTGESDNARAAPWARGSESDLGGVDER
ncbi:hypothetical protein [Streptomyces sp. NPDC001315]